MSTVVTYHTFFVMTVIRSDDKELAIVRYTNEFEGTSTLLQRIEVTGKWKMYSTISSSAGKFTVEHACVQQLSMGSRVTL